MENRVITIARSYGSGGRKMGKLLAKELGFEYYDREILRIASDESGISEELFNQVDEIKKMPLFRIARDVYTGEVIPPDSDDFISNENLFRYQAKIIRELAATRNCVIVGRCAHSPRAGKCAECIRYRAGRGLRSQGYGTGRTEFGRSGKENQEGR